MLLIFLGVMARQNDLVPPACRRPANQSGSLFVNSKNLHGEICTRLSEEVVAVSSPLLFRAVPLGQTSMPGGLVESGHPSGVGRALAVNGGDGLFIMR